MLRLFRHRKYFDIDVFMSILRHDTDHDVFIYLYMHGCVYTFHVHQFFVELFAVMIDHLMEKYRI